MYKVIEKFRDLTDGHLYEPGDAFPFDGREIPAARLDALVNGQNRANKRLIATVEEIPTEAPKTAKKGRRAANK